MTISNIFLLRQLASEDSIRSRKSKICYLIEGADWF